MWKYINRLQNFSTTRFSFSERKEWGGREKFPSSAPFCSSCDTKTSSYFPISLNRFYKDETKRVAILLGRSEKEGENWCDCLN